MSQPSILNQTILFKGSSHLISSCYCIQTHKTRRDHTSNSGRQASSHSVTPLSQDFGSSRRRRRPLLPPRHREYNFVGPPNSSKLTWTDELMKRVDVGGEESGSSTSSLPHGKCKCNAASAYIYLVYYSYPDSRRKKMYFFFSSKLEDRKRWEGNMRRRQLPFRCSPSGSGQGWMLRSARWSLVTQRAERHLLRAAGYKSPPLLLQLLSTRSTPSAMAHPCLITKVPLQLQVGR